MCDQKDKGKNDLKERFAKWHKYTLDERGKVINLLITLSLGTIAFVVNLIINNEHFFQNECCVLKAMLLFGLLILLFCLGYLIIISMLRVNNFSKTVRLLRFRRAKEKKETTLDGCAIGSEIDRIKKITDKYDKNILEGINTSQILFLAGEVFVIIYFIIVLFRKL